MTNYKPKHNSLITCFALFYLMIVTSCSPILYSPTSQNVPLLEEKGEVMLSGNFSSTWELEGFGMKGAVAIDSSLAIAANYNRLGGTDNSDEDWDVGFNYVETAFGKFGLIKDTFIVYEVFLGLGYGSAKNERNQGIIQGKYIKPYLQPSVGYRSKFIDIAITPRIAVINYVSDLVTIADQEMEIAANNFFSDNQTNIVFEPGMTMRLGYEKIKLEFQFVYTTFANLDSHILTNHDTLWTFGLIIFL